MWLLAAISFFGILNDNYKISRPQREMAAAIDGLLSSSKFARSASHEWPKDKQIIARTEFNRGRESSFRLMDFADKVQDDKDANRFSAFNFVRFEFEKMRVNRSASTLAGMRETSNPSPRMVAEAR